MGFDPCPMSLDRATLHRGKSRRQLDPGKFPERCVFQRDVLGSAAGESTGMQIHRQGAKVAKGRGEFRSFGVSEFRLYSTADGSGVDRKAPRAARIRKNFVPMDRSRKAIPGLSKRSSSPPLLKNLGDLGDLAVPPIFN
jgi:hypothetical protein